MAKDGRRWCDELAGPVPRGVTKSSTVHLLCYCDMYFSNAAQYTTVNRVPTTVAAADVSQSEQYSQRGGPTLSRQTDGLPPSRHGRVVARQHARRRQGPAAPRSGGTSGSSARASTSRGGTPAAWMPPPGPAGCPPLVRPRSHWAGFTLGVAKAEGVGLSGR